MVKDISIKIGLLCFSISFVLFSIEIFLRFTEYRYLIVSYPLPLNYFKLDTDTGYDIQNNFPPVRVEFRGLTYKVWSNELGCFDKPYRNETDFILLVGDSFTWGYTPFEYKWGTIIEREFNKRVLKCAVTGYGTKQEGIKICKVVDKVKRFPQLIIVGYCIGNDLEDDYLFPHYSIINGYKVTKVDLHDKKTGRKIVYSDSELKKRFEIFQKFGTPEISDKSKIYRTKLWLLHHSILYNFLLKNKLFILAKGKIKGYFQKEGGGGQANDPPLYLIKPEKYPWIDTAWHDHLVNLKDIKINADTVGAKLLVVIIPTKEQVYTCLRPLLLKDVDWDYANKRLSAFFENEKISYIDLTPLFRDYANQEPRQHLDSEKDLYWRNDNHWNIKGNLLAGLLVSKFILGNHMIETSDPDLKIFKINNELQNMHN